MTTPVKIIKPRRFGDNRGWFSETWSAATFEAMGLNIPFVQDNHSLSKPVGTVRGIHFQRPPHAQIKLVRCIRGAILDVADDLSAQSPTYGQHVAVELSADNGLQLLVPVGYGHAFVTLQPDTEVVYKVSDIYAPECDGGILWSDPALGIDWPLPTEGAMVSSKDAILPALSQFDSPFAYDGVPLGTTAVLSAV